MSSALLVFAQEIEKQLSRRVRQEGLSGELGWCLVRYYRELIDGVYNDADGDEPADEVEDADARGKLIGIYNRFESDLKRLADAGSSLETFSPISDDDEGSVLDDIASVYYDDLDESSPEPDELPQTPSRTPVSLYEASEGVPSMIMSEDVSFLVIATPIPERPGNPTPTATGKEKFPPIPFTPLPKHSFPGTLNPERLAELSLSRGVPYEAQHVNINSLDISLLLGNGNGQRGFISTSPTETVSSTNSLSSDGQKKMKKKRSFWKRSSSSDQEKPQKKKGKLREELKAPTFWSPM